MGKKVGMVSLGCAKNLVDSENVLGMLRDAGYEIVPDPAEAEIIFVNTCGFIESAKTARTFKTWDEAKETERNAYLAEFPVRPKPLGYMVYGGVNRWFVPVNRSSFVLFLR